MKTFKLRIYPNQAQRLQITKNFGDCRFIWNELLAMQIKRYDNGGKYINAFGMNYLLKPLKQQYPWLKEADSTSLTAVSQQLHGAFQKFFKKNAGFPRFKARRYARMAYESKAVNGNIVVIDSHHIKIPKLGAVYYRGGQIPQGKIKLVTVKCTPVGHYYVAVTTEMDIKPLETIGAIVGLDLGLTNSVITSDGTKYPTVHFDKKLAEKKHYWEKRLARRRLLAEKAIAWDKHLKVENPRELGDFKNYVKAKQMVAKYSEKVANQRHDYLHKISKAIIIDYDVIKLESLRTKNMMRNHKLARAIANQAWRMLRTMIEYKATWYGKQVIIVSPYKTSQICSECGYDDGYHGLGVRDWVCPQCHYHHDRDINAAINICQAKSLV